MPNLTLDNITVHLKPGDLLAVIGSVGSGKVLFLIYVIYKYRSETLKIKIIF